MRVLGVDPGTATLGYGVVDAGPPLRLVECGAHWEPASATMATDVTLRFLRHLGMIDDAWMAASPRLPTPARQRLVRVGEGVTAASPDFRFLLPTHHLKLIPAAGTPLAEDGARRWVTPHDDCVLIMPSRRAGVAGRYQSGRP